MDKKKIDNSSLSPEAILDIDKEYFFDVLTLENQSQQNKRFNDKMPENIQKSLPHHPQINTSKYSTVPPDAMIEVLDVPRPRNTRESQKVDRKASEKGSEFEMIDPDEDSINDYHNAYKLEKDTTTIKQKFMQKITNIGFKLFKSGDKKGIDKQEAKKLQMLRDTQRSNDSQSLRYSEVTVNSKWFAENGQKMAEGSPKNQMKNSNRILSHQFDEKPEGINLFGEEFHDQIDLFYQKYRQLIWITYRYNFRPLLIEKLMLQGRKVQNLTSDNNWGCTIRAGQMLLANSIREATSDLTVQDVLDLFDDNYRGKREHAYSIQNVAVEGLKYGKLPGDWYGVGAVSNIMETLTERFEPVPNFKICVFQEGNIILEDIESRAMPLSQLIKSEVSKRDEAESVEVKDDGLLIKSESCKDNFLAEFYRKNRLESMEYRKRMSVAIPLIKDQEEEVKQMPEQQQNEEERESSGEGMEHQQASESPENTEIGRSEKIEIQAEEMVFGSQFGQEEQDNWVNKVLVIVNVRLGMDRIAEEYFDSILSFTKLPQFVGILGGKPRKAFYFVGAHQPSQQLVFLDPHFVTKHAPDITKDNYYQQNRHKFHCTESSARMIHLSKLDPCLSFAFLIQSQSNFQDFKSQLESSFEKCTSNIFNVFSSHEQFLKDLDANAIRSVHTMSFRQSMFEKK